MKHETIVAVEAVTLEQAEAEQRALAEKERLRRLDAFAEQERLRRHQAPERTLQQRAEALQREKRMQEAAIQQAPQARPERCDCTAGRSAFLQPVARYVAKLIG